jgi:hypothetical protein
VFGDTVAAGAGQRRWVRRDRCGLAVDVSKLVPRGRSWCFLLFVKNESSIYPQWILRQSPVYRKYFARFFCAQQKTGTQVHPTARFVSAHLQRE